eukprot:6472787-Amphidinium_carterae.2
MSHACPTVDVEDWFMLTSTSRWQVDICSLTSSTRDCEVLHPNGARSSCEQMFQTKLPMLACQ